MTPPATYDGLAAAVNHLLLDPELDNARIVAGLELAKRLGAGVATVRPCDADLAVRTLGDSPCRAAAIAGYPHGYQNTSVKLYEARDLLRRGVKEIGAAVATARLVSREFQHLQTELNQLTEACRGEGARLTVYLDTATLTDELKIIACACIERAEVDFVAVAGAGDLALLRKHLPDETGVQVSGVTGLEAALELRSAGVARIATSATREILDAWKQRLAPPASTA